MYSDGWMRKARWLTQALIISGTLNIGLISTFVYFVLKEKQTSVAFELKPSQEEEQFVLTNKELVEAYLTLSFQDLLLRLEDRELIEEGYAKRDIALACLVNFHQFNLEGALGGFVPQQRYIKFFNEDGGELIDLSIYPALTEDQFQAVIQYARTEKWPFTSEGLFFELKGTTLDRSLLDAFYLMPEFQAVQTLFVRAGLKVKNEEIIQLLIAGDFSSLDIFTKEQKLLQDLSPNRLKMFLVEYLNMGSKEAARWLLDLDVEFVTKRLDDKQTLLVLDLLTEKTNTLEHFAKELLVSPRSDLIWKQAASLLYSFAGEKLPEPYDSNVARARFLPHLITPKKIEEVAQILPAKKPPQKSPLIKTSKTHVIQNGESLWKIARKYKVTIESIIDLNHLESDRLRVGRTLEIPVNER